MGILSVVIVVLGICALAVGMSILNGFVFYKLWGWFIVPVFHTPELGIVTAMGIALLVSFLTSQTHHEYKDHERKNGWIVLVQPFIVLGIGYIIKCFL